MVKYKGNDGTKELQETLFQVYLEIIYQNNWE